VWDFWDAWKGPLLFPQRTRDEVGALGDADFRQDDDCVAEQGYAVKSRSYSRIAELMTALHVSRVDFRRRWCEERAGPDPLLPRRSKPALAVRRTLIGQRRNNQSSRPLGEVKSSRIHKSMRERNTLARKLFPSAAMVNRCSGLMLVSTDRPGVVIVCST
jgi:hypothetical protein